MPKIDRTIFPADYRWFELSHDKSRLVWQPRDESEREDWLDAVKRTPDHAVSNALFDIGDGVFGPLGNGWTLINLEDAFSDWAFHQEWTSVCKRNGWDKHFIYRKPSQTHITQPSFMEWWGRMLPNLPPNFTNAMLLVWNAALDDDGEYYEISYDSVMFVAQRHHVYTALKALRSITFERVHFADDGTLQALADSGLSGKRNYIGCIAHNARVADDFKGLCLHILDDDANVTPDFFITDNWKNPAYYISVPFLQYRHTDTELEHERVEYLKDQPESD